MSFGWMEEGRWVGGWVIRERGERDRSREGVRGDEKGNSVISMQETFLGADFRFLSGPPSPPHLRYSLFTRYAKFPALYNTEIPGPWHSS